MEASPGPGPARWAPAPSHPVPDAKGFTSQGKRALRRQLLTRLTDPFCVRDPRANQAGTLQNAGARQKLS
ncbi:hypothetical protein GCM10025331_51330 [Actinoplanes utahensis]